MNLEILVVAERGQPYNMLISPLVIYYYWQGIETMEYFIILIEPTIISHTLKTLYWITMQFSFMLIRGQYH